MKAIRVTVFKCSDGKQFDKKEEARAHETKLKFLEEYEKTDQLWGYYDGRVDPNKIWDFMVEHGVDLSGFTA